MDKDFLTHLMEETFTEHKESIENNIVSLEDYFSAKESSIKGYQTIENINLESLNHELIQKSKNDSVLGRFIPSINAYRFRIQSQLVDFPKNWSIFESISNMEKSEEFIFAFSLDQDKDMLGKIFNIDSGAICFYFKDGLFNVFQVKNEYLEFLKKESSPKAA